jgi:hypothetical protein
VCDSCWKRQRSKAYPCWKKLGKKMKLLNKHVDL